MLRGPRLPALRRGRAWAEDRRVRVTVECVHAGGAGQGSRAKSWRFIQPPSRPRGGRDSMNVSPSTFPCDLSLIQARRASY